MRQRQKVNTRLIRFGNTGQQKTADKKFSYLDQLDAQPFVWGYSPEAALPVVIPDLILSSR